MNAFFPLSVALAGWVLVEMALAAQAADAVARLSLTLAGTMLALAILEHLLLVLPVRSTALWRWAMARHDEKLQHAR
jgi:putative photosynthetic complex assembly protein 2